MKITINGKEQQFVSVSNLGQIIENFCKQNNRVIAEVNGEIVKSKQWEKTPLNDGDKVELVSFVGGG